LKSGRVQTNSQGNNFKQLKVSILYKQNVN
jgi:hypothetical protein